MRIEIPRFRDEIAPLHGELIEGVVISLDNGMMVRVIGYKAMIAYDEGIGRRDLWYLTVEPLLGMTLVEKLSVLVEETLVNIGLPQVEATLRAAVFSRKAMDILSELEEE